MRNPITLERFLEVARQVVNSVMLNVLLSELPIDQRRCATARESNLEEEVATVDIFEIKYMGISQTSIKEED